MIEEPIQEVLEVVGVDLTFPTFGFLAIPGFELNTLYKGETSLYEVTKQEFSFQCATEDTLQAALDGLVFTITDDNYVFTFTVSRTPLDDLTGWSVIYTNFTGKVKA